MSQKYECKFVRLGESFGFFSIKRPSRLEYQEVIHEHAHQGWRLVQIFAPGTAVYGAAKYFEMIFEREVR